MAFLNLQKDLNKLKKTIEDENIAEDGDTNQSEEDSDDREPAAKKQVEEKKSVGENLVAKTFAFVDVGDRQLAMVCSILLPFAFSYVTLAYTV